MGCIPIVTKHPTYLELRRRGLPLLIVDDWAEITDQRLKVEYPTLFREVMDFRSTLMDLDKWWTFSFQSAGDEGPPRHPWLVSGDLC